MPRSYFYENWNVAHADPRLGGRNQQNPAEELLGKDWRKHRDWTNDQWFDYLIAEINKPQDENLIFGCLEYCIVEAIDHYRRYWWCDEKQEREEANRTQKAEAGRSR